MPDMIVKTFKYRVKDRSASKRLGAMANAVDLVWNHCNAAQRHALKHNTQWPTYRALHDLTTGVGKMIGLPAQSVQSVCRGYHDKRTAARKAKLRWRGERSLGWIPFPNQAATLVVNKGAIKFNGQLFRLWLHRPVEGAIKSGSFSQDARGRWYCNLAVEYEARPHGRNAEVGIDLGLKDTATLSTGAKIENARIFTAYAAILAQAQRANKSRRVKAIHAKIANVRKEFVHTRTTEIAQQFGFIAVGNVSGKWLQASNGKSSTDAATGMFRNALRYKAIAHGAQFVDVSEYLSTQTCSDCKTVGGPKGTKGLEIREWTCGHCGSIHDRDVNAARNILRLGRETLVEGSSNHSRQA